MNTFVSYRYLEIYSSWLYIWKSHRTLEIGFKNPLFHIWHGRRRKIRLTAPHQSWRNIVKFILNRKPPKKSVSSKIVLLVLSFILQIRKNCPICLYFCSRGFFECFFICFFHFICETEDFQTRYPGSKVNYISHIYFWVSVRGFHWMHILQPQTVPFVGVYCICRCI